MWCEAACAETRQVSARRRTTNSDEAVPSTPSAHWARATRRASAAGSATRPGRAVERAFVVVATTVEITRSAVTMQRSTMARKTKTDLPGTFEGETVTRR